MLARNSKRIWEGTQRFIARNALDFFALFGISLLVYLPFYANNLANPDGLGEVEWMRTPDWCLAYGRWGWFVTDFIKPHINTMPLPIFCSLLFYCVGALLFTELFGVRNRLVRLMAATCFVCSPMVPSTITYPNISFDYGMGFLLAVLSIFLTVKYKNILVGGLAVLLLTLSISLSQINISYAGAAGITFLLNAWIKDHENLKAWLTQVVKIAFIGLLGTGLYYLIMRLILHFGGYAFETGYYTTGIMDVLPQLPKTIVNAYRSFADYFFTSKIMSNAYWQKGINAVLFVFFVGVVIAEACRIRKPFAVVVFLACITVTPVAFCLVNLFLVQYPSLTLHMSSGLCLFIPFVILLGCDEDTNIFSRFGALAKIICGTIAICCIWNYAMIDSADAAAMKYTKDMTVAVANRVYSRVEADPRYDRQTTKLVLIGSPDLAIETFPDYMKTNDYVKWGIFWDNPLSTCSGWNQIFRLYVDRRVLWGSYDDVNALCENEMYKRMPVYPASGSMEVIDGIYVVKMKNY